MRFSPSSRTRIYYATVLALAMLEGRSRAADWPQFRGPNRDGSAADFTPPASWPKELTRKWKVAVGVGDATPALVGDNLYVSARQGGNEMTLCLSAADGKIIWQDKYSTDISVGGPASGHQGPRSSPAVADGKVVTLDEGATVSGLDAASGKVLWRKDFSKDLSVAWPNFYTALSPLITDNVCIVYLGGRGNGSVFALDLTTGERKWKWDGEAPAYASPVTMTVDGSKQIVVETERSVVGLAAADGKLLWQSSFGGGGRGGMRGGPGGGGPGGGPGGPGGGPPDRGPGGGPPGADRGRPGGGGGGRGRGGGGGMSYNAATPVVDGQTVILTSGGSGTKAIQIEKTTDGFAAKEAWTNPQIGSQFCSPVVHDGCVYGLTAGGNLFCLDSKTGKTLWTSSDRFGERGFGTIVSAGSVMMLLGSDSELTIFKPSAKAYEQVAQLKASDSPGYAYPIAAGNRIIVKDRDSVILYALESSAQ